jgi:thiol-disulfide isomerase/thioredoxin
MHARFRRLATILALLAIVTACAAPADPGSSLTPASTEPASTEPAVMAPSDAPMATTLPSSTSEASLEPSPSVTVFDDPLLAIELLDVRTDETFTLGELAADGPVIVETMAIWCTNCRAQMHEVTAAHELAEFHSVSIDVQSDELAEDLVAYAEREGFDWPFVLADAQLATTLRDRFGTEVLFPPGMPKLLVRPDGSVELLPLGDLLSADEIAALVTG